MLFVQDVMALLHEELLHNTVWVRRVRCRNDRIGAANLLRSDVELQPERYLLRWRTNEHHYCDYYYTIRLHDISIKCYHVTLASLLFLLSLFLIFSLLYLFMSIHLMHIVVTKHVIRPATPQSFAQAKENSYGGLSFFSILSKARAEHKSCIFLPKFLFMCFLFLYIISSLMLIFCPVSLMLGYFLRLITVEYA